MNFLNCDHRVRVGADAARVDGGRAAQAVPRVHAHRRHPRRAVVQRPAARREKEEEEEKERRHFRFRFIILLVL